MKRILLNITDEMYQEMRDVMYHRHQACVTTFIRQAIQGDISQFAIDHPNAQVGKLPTEADAMASAQLIEDSVARYDKRVKKSTLPPGMKLTALKPKPVTVTKAWGVPPAQVK